MHFSRDIERQNRLKLKRERPPDDVGTNAHKRQDTGDSKISSLPPPTSQPHIQTTNGVSTQHSTPPSNPAQPILPARQPSAEVSQTLGMNAPPTNTIRHMSQPLSTTPSLHTALAGSPTHAGRSQTPSMGDTHQKSLPNFSNPAQHGMSHAQMNSLVTAQLAQQLNDPNNQQMLKFFAQS